MFFFRTVCQNPPVITPETTFQFRSSLLQIFTSFQIQCRGSVYKWAFISRTETGSGLYLSVWRPVVQGRDERFRLVGTSAVPEYRVTPNTWFEWIEPNPYLVQPGDVIAIYYGQWQEPWSHNGYVPVTSPFTRVPSAATQFSGRTLVVQKDAEQIQTELSRNGGVIDVTNSSIVNDRFPAVIAFVNTSLIPVVTAAPTQATPPPFTFAPTPPPTPCGVTNAPTPPTPPPNCRSCVQETPFSNSILRTPPPNFPANTLVPLSGIGGHSTRKFNDDIFTYISIFIHRMFRTFSFYWNLQFYSEQIFNKIFFQCSTKGM